MPGTLHPRGGDQAGLGQLANSRPWAPSLALRKIKKRPRLIMPGVGAGGEELELPQAAGREVTGRLLRNQTCACREVQPFHAQVFARRNEEWPHGASHTAKGCGICKSQGARTTRDCPHRRPKWNAVDRKLLCHRQGLPEEQGLTRRAGTPPTCRDSPDVQMHSTPTRCIAATQRGRVSPSPREAGTV